MPILVGGFVVCAAVVVGFGMMDLASSRHDSANSIENPTSPQMQVAVDLARRNWPEFVTAFESAKPGDAFLVKVACSEGGPVEHMWINVTAMNNRAISGTLDSRPQLLRKVKCGDPIQVALNEVEDWTYVSNGQRHGYFSSAESMAEQAAAEQGGQSAQMPQQPAAGQGGGLGALMQSFFAEPAGGGNSDAGQDSQTAESADSQAQDDRGQQEESQQEESQQQESQQQESDQDNR